MKKIIIIIVVLIGGVVFYFNANVIKVADWVECSACHGTGKIEIKEKCSVCKGRGEVNCTYSYTSSKSSEYNIFRGSFKYYTYTECDRGVAKKYSVFDDEDGSPDYYLESSNTCPQCDGRAVHDCPSCSGYGEITTKIGCEKCNAGHILTYKRITFSEWDWK